MCTCSVLCPCITSPPQIEENQKNNAKMDSKELEQLLRQGAYAVLLEDDAEVVKQFCEQVSHGVQNV